MTETVGKILKKARIEKKLTLDQVFQSLHIRQHYLEALENDQRELLPSEVQGRGFFRLYADFLDLPLPLMLDYWDGKIPAEQHEILPEQSEPVPEIDSRSELAGETKETINSQGFSTSVARDEDLVTNENSSHAIFNEIGKRLRSQRETISLHLEDVEEQLHIRIFYLNALEEGRVDDLPSIAQARGMIANYAKFLELDSDEFITRFAEALQARRIEKTGKAPDRKEISSQRDSRTHSSSWKRVITPDLLFGSLGIFIFAAVIIWTVSRVTTVRNQQQEPTALSLAEVLLVSPTPSLISMNIAETAVPTLVEDGLIVPLDSIVGGEPTSIPTLDDQPLQVYVVALQRAWLKITVDGKSAFNARVIPGNAYSFSGKEIIELVTGNAAGLRVYFNQNEIGTLGIPNQVANLIFVPEGVLSPTPRFTATPTATPTPTVSPQPSPTIATPTVTVYVP